MDYERLAWVMYLPTAVSLSIGACYCSMRIDVVKRGAWLYALGFAVGMVLGSLNAAMFFIEVL